MPSLKDRIYKFLGIPQTLNNLDELIDKARKTQENPGIFIRLNMQPASSQGPEYQYICAVEIKIKNSGLKVWESEAFKMKYNAELDQFKDPPCHPCMELAREKTREAASFLESRGITPTIYGRYFI